MRPVHIHGLHERLTSQDAFTAAELASLLSKVLGRPIQAFDGPLDALPMAGYFRLVAAGIYKTTDTAAKLLGRTPRSYAHWLGEHRPFAT